MTGRMWLGGALLLAGCSQPKGEAVNADVPDATAPTESLPANEADEVGGADKAAAAATPDASGNFSMFTTNDPKKCRIVEKNEEEGGYFRYRCPGSGGFNYELVESDLRQSLVILGPGGRRDDLAMAGTVGGGGFSILGRTFEWRGPAGQPPRTLTVRFNVNEKPQSKAPPTSYLVVIKLAAAACPVQAVPPGPNQSDHARATADQEKLPACLKS